MSSAVARIPLQSFREVSISRKQRILNILLDLPFLQAGRGIAELRFEHIVAGHRQETDIDVALFSTADLVDGRAHVVVDAAAGDAVEDPECMIMGIDSISWVWRR